MPELRSHAHFLALPGHLDLVLKKITHNCVISQSKPHALEEMVLSGHNHDKGSLHLLSPPGGKCFVVPFFAKRMVMPTELHMRGLLQNMVARQISGKNPRHIRLKKRIPSKKRSLPLARIIPKFVEFMAVHFTN